MVARAVATVIRYRVPRRGYRGDGYRGEGCGAVVMVGALEFSMCGLAVEWALEAVVAF